MANATLKRTRRTVKGRGANSGVPCTHETSQAALRSRATRLLDHEIDFIANAEFRSPEARRAILDARAPRNRTSNDARKQGSQGPAGPSGSPVREPTADGE